MYPRHLVVIAALILTGCAGTAPNIAGVGLFKPDGLHGKEHCKKSGKCIIRTRVTGPTAMSIKKNSAVMVSFSGDGGDVLNYFDYLITIRNLSNKDIRFDPNNVPGYDESALLKAIKSKQEELASITALTAFSMTFGGNPGNLHAIDFLSKTYDRERTGKEKHIVMQRLRAATISPGGTITGRLIVRGKSKIPERMGLYITVGNETHEVNFHKTDVDSILERMSKPRLTRVPRGFGFDGRWVYYSEDGEVMHLSIFETDGRKIKQTYATGEILEGIIRGATVTFPANPGNYIWGKKLYILDKNTLLTEPIMYRHVRGDGLYVRQ